MNTKQTNLIPTGARRVLWLTALGLAIGAAGPACLYETFRQPNENHCANQNGNAWCAERHDGTRPYCILGNGVCGPTEDRDGCVAALPTNDCYSPCGFSMTVVDDASCIDATASSGSTAGTESSSSDTGNTGDSGATESTTGPMPCLMDEDCSDAAAPYCNPLGECVDCAGMDDPDAACLGTDPGNPLCVDGACVTCTAEDTSVCDGDLLLCDDEANACVGCTEHTQCGSGACELAVGRCFAEDVVVHVDADGGQDFMSVAAAVDSIDEGLHGVVVVHEIDGDLAYQGLVQVDGGKTVALLAAPDEAPIIQGTGGNPGVRVEAAGTVLYADGLQISNGAAQGLTVDTATAWVDRSRIVGNDGGGVLASNAAELTLRNCFVGGNIDDVDGLAMDASSLTMLYTTVGAGGSFVTESRAVFCSGVSTADIRNSIILSADDVPELQCPGAVTSNNATESMVGFDPAWFANYISGDFALTAAGQTTFENLAVWQDGDPLEDIDGTARPAADGAMDYAGADVP